MKGLLIKDIQLLLANKRVFAVVVFCGVMMFFVEDGSMFVVGYITFVFALQALNTVAYDQMDHCDLYLFTLPVSRRQYVTENSFTSALDLRFQSVFSHFEP